MVRNEPMEQSLSLACSSTPEFCTLPSEVLCMEQIHSQRLGVGQVMPPAGKPILLGQITAELGFNTVV